MKFTKCKKQIDFQMQPYIIKKNRTLSLPARFMIATVATTVLVISYRTVIRPYLSQRQSNQMKNFADEYFTKLEQQKREQPSS